MSDKKTIEFSALCEKSAKCTTLRNVVLSSSKTGDVLKIKGTLKSVSSDTVLQLEYFCTEGRVRQENIRLSDVSARIEALCNDFFRCDLNDSGGNASLMTSKKGKVSLVRHGNIGVGDALVKPADKEKKYILKGNEPFLFYLGISDKNGRVHDKKQSKYRQINKFLEYTGDMLKYLPKSGELRIADLCCGKSYLSFAVYHYFVNILGREVKMDCMDLKESVMEFCADIADKCAFSGMSFASGDVNLYQPEKSPHMVISLHACDVATDIVIDRAIKLGAGVIMSTPCCHRELSRKIDCDKLKFISDNSVLKSKFCDAATDSLRILRLKACGYAASATEFIDPEDTPKNVLIRAHREQGFDFGRMEKYKKEYEAAYYFLCGTDAPELPERK